MATPALADPRANHLLRSLPQADWQRWASALEQVDMPLGQVLYERLGFEHTGRRYVRRFD